MVQRHRIGFESRTARVNLKENNEETSAEGKERYRKPLQSGFAKEFGRGVRQQQTRGKTKERAGTLPLALSMFRRNASADGEIDMLKWATFKECLSEKYPPKYDFQRSLDEDFVRFESYLEAEILVSNFSLYELSVNRRKNITI